MTVWPTKIAIVRADHEALFAAGEAFNPSFLENCRQWTVLRFMDWLNTNYRTGQTGAKSWTSRPSKDYLTWCQDDGVPIEICAELCVKAGCSMWYNVPFNYDTDSWRSAISFLRDALGPRHLHVEYSNEVWNYAFQQAHDALAAGQKTIVNGERGGAGTYYGTQTAAIMKDAIAIFGRERGRLTTHLGVQQVNRQTYLDAERGFRVVGCEVGDLIDEVSGTFYIDGGFQGDAPAGIQTVQKDAILSIARSVNNGGAEREKALATAFAQLESGGQSGFAHDGVTIASHKRDSEDWYKLSNDRGWDFGFYEGQLYHWSLAGSWTPSEQDILLRFIGVVLDDPRIGSQIRDVLMFDRSRFRGVFMVYFDIRADDGKPGIFGPWGTQPTLYSRQTVRQKAYLGMQLRRGSASRNPSAYGGLKRLNGSAMQPRA